MVSREMSESMNPVENDQILNDAAANAAEVKPEAEKAEEVVKPEETKVAEVLPETEPEKEAVVSEPEPVEETVAPAAVEETAAPVVEETAPVVEEAASVVEETAPVVEEAQPEAEQAEEPDYTTMTKAQLVEALQELVKKDVESVRDSVAHIKNAFFNIRKAELAKEKEEFLAKGNEDAAFAPMTDSDEEKVKELLNVVKERRAEYHATLEAEKENNLERKLKIIDEITSISEDTDNVNRQFTRVQQLQQEFKSIGEVPAPKATDLWKRYQQAVERFYDVLKVNKDLRDYDFKKNLEIKQQLCLEAEKLDEQENVIEAFKKLQELHNTWRETGPVAKELREELWARFKTASSVINKKHQSFFEERKSQEKANADAKTALCEQIETISTEGLNSYQAWDNATKQIIALQEEWKKLGFASRKLNAELFKRFRKSCDDFFEKKANFFKSMKETLQGNYEKKVALCERAEAMKDSTDWKKTTDEFVALQKEWKTIGPVMKKQSDAVWKRFIAACDFFFEEKKKNTTSTRTIEHENFKTKKGIIASIKKLLEEDMDSTEAAKAVRELMAQWQQVGHVPFKEKDKIYADYKEVIDQAFDKLNMKAARANLANFENAISQMGDSDKVYQERERLLRSYEQKRNELKTYENNLGFFTAKSKDGNNIVKDMEKKIAKLKDEIALLEQKIKLIDEKA